MRKLAIGAMWGGLGTAELQRIAKVTVNATPEPAVKDRTLTVKGKLTRADWARRACTGYVPRATNDRAALRSRCGPTRPQRPALM
ncbi:hypothetical protein WBG99_23930 [Streptomyces sp. TG1A-60]|uniref:hypothetical protein n=1 Tax=Streptomyces sp. TG1A-60 TaxID=3129111 RepID=UPI0030D5CC2A